MAKPVVKAPRVKRGSTAKAPAKPRRPRARAAEAPIPAAVPQLARSADEAAPGPGLAPIRQLAHEQFAALFAAFVADPSNRTIDAVHLHHTWRPRHADFRGRLTVEAMRRYHVQDRGWSDIAQHITIDPAGGLWTGRSWNAPPASSAGRNGTAARGPFMFEMVGDFDVGRDPFVGAQRASAIEAVAAIVVASQASSHPLTTADLWFHRELGSPKTCPGTSIDKAALVALVDRRVVELTAASRRAPAPRGGPALPAYASLSAASGLFRSLTGRPGAGDGPAAAVDESAYAGALVRHLEHAAGVAAPRISVADVADAVARGGGDWQELRPHVVNLSKGRLSTGGEFAMDAESLDAIVDGIRGYARTTPQPRVALWAHGGLVSETDGLHYAKATRAWWLTHGVYPVYFVWETGFLETILQAILGARFVGDLWDAAVEQLARPVGLPTWSAIKTSACLASSADTGDGWPGGAWQFANALANVVHELAGGGPALELHAIGHSAGAIFHSHFLPELAARNVGVATLSLLAPAIRVDRFGQSLQPLRTAGTIGTLHLYTMNEEAELSDTVGPYLKSLLYLVSRACEPRQPTPILGLQESLDADAALTAWLAQNATVEFAVPADRAPNPLCQALAHGDFDNDRYTVSAVLRCIKGVPHATGEGRDDFPQEESSRARAAALRALEPSARAGTPAAVAPAGGRRRALCVGIDRYAQRPLAGCVADAGRWAAALGALAFDVKTLLDGDATRAAILAALEALVADAHPGDLVVLQYSGHGTQVEDLDADEGDGYDEAFVPVDYAAGHLLLDDDFARVAARLRAGAVLTLFMDCCHSGTISRFAVRADEGAATDERVRYLPLSPADVAAHVAFRRAAGGAAKASEESLPGVVHFAACRDNEYAWESQGQGDFTRAAVPLLAAAVLRGDTNEAFNEAVAAAVGKRGRQHPGLMRLPANLRARALLGGPGGRAAPTPAVGAAGGSDAELLALAEAMVAALRARGAGAAGA